MENITPKYNLIPKKEKIQIPMLYNESVDSGSLVGGWKATANELRKGKISLQGNNERILIGDASAPMTGKGIFLGKDGSDYEFRVGDVANSKYLHYDGADIVLKGSSVENVIISSIQAGSEIAIQGWQHDMAFSATDHDTVAWASGTITLLDGTTYNITGANTSTMSAITYIYLDIGTSTTALQTTTTAGTAVGSGKILISVAQNVASGNLATFQVFGGKALGGLGKLIVASDITANTITANEILANTLTAAEIAATTITATEISTGLYNEIDANLPSDENLVGYWAFDEGAGSKAYDGSGENNDGTLTNMEEADWVDGIAGSCLNFDGADEYIDCGTGTGTVLGNSVTEISVSLWFKADATNGNDGLFELGNFDDSFGELELAVISNKLFFKLDGNTFNHFVAFTDTASWHHLVAVYNGTTGKLYLDNVEIISENYSAGLDLSGLKTVIGAWYNNSSTFNGKIDEVRIYNAILTAKETYALYKNPSGQPSLALPMGRLTSGSIYSKQITLAVTGGTGDSYIAGGKTDFTNTDNGFILGVDDSDSDKAKFYLGNSTDYFNWDGSNVKILCSSSDALEIASGSDVLLSYGGDIKFTSVTKPTACTATLIATPTGNVNNGTHKYMVTYVNDSGETDTSLASNIVTNDATHKQNSLTNIPTSSLGSVISRKIYRTKAGGSLYYLLTTIADNTTTTYTDNTADASLTEDGLANFRENSSFGKLFIDNIKTLHLGDSNSFMGKYSGYSNTTGYTNVFVGGSSGHFNTSGYYNTFYGSGAGYNNTTGYENTFIGMQAGKPNKAGYQNTFVGTWTGLNSYTGGSENYHGNVLIGYKAGYGIGASDRLYIANSSTSTPLIYGEFDNKNLGFSLKSFGGGKGVISIANATVVPTSNPTGGGILYCQGGALKFRGSSGTVTTIANA